jgi:hypothetical protein
VVKPSFERIFCRTFNIKNWFYPSFFPVTYSRFSLCFQGVSFKRFARREFDIKKVWWWEPTILEWNVDVAVIWCFLLGACDVTDILICEEKNCSTYAENTGHLRKAFSRQGIQAAWICLMLRDVIMLPIRRWHTCNTQNVFKRNRFLRSLHAVVQLLTVEFAVDLDTGLRWGKSTTPYLWPVNDVFQLIIQLAEVQSCFVRGR